MHLPAGQPEDAPDVATVRQVLWRITSRPPVSVVRSTFQCVGSHRLLRMPLGSRAQLTAAAPRTPSAPMAVFARSWMVQPNSLAMADVSKNEPPTASETTARVRVMAVGSAAATYRPATAARPSVGSMMASVSWRTPCTRTHDAGTATVQPRKLAHAEVSNDACQMRKPALAVPAPTDASPAPLAWTCSLQTALTRCPKMRTQSNRCVAASVSPVISSSSAPASVSSSLPSAAAITRVDSANWCAYSVVVMIMVE